MWSGFDTCILIAGIISAAVAVVPVKGISAQHRLIGGAVGGGLIVMSLVLGSLQSFTYPGIVVVMPFIAALLVGAVIYQAVRRDQPGALDGELGFTMPRAAATAAALAVESDDAAAAEARTAARNPATSPEELARLAHASRELWPDIAANPAAYPGLLDWLGQHGGPDIAAIIARRSAS